MSIWSFLALQLVLLFLLCGVGLAVSSLVSRNGREEVVPWIGLTSLLAILPAIHLFVPMAGTAASLIVVLAVAGWMGAAPRLREEWLRWARFVGVFVAMSIAFAWPVSMTCALQYDWGLYYQQAQKWAVACPVVPGIGNLHGRLAFPGTSFLFAGLLDGLCGPYWGARMLGGQVLSLAIASFVVLLARSIRRDDGFLLGFGVTSLLFLSTTLQTASTAVAAPDLLVAVLTLLVCLQAFRLLRGEMDAGDLLPPLVTGIVLLKMSSAVFAAAVVALLLWKARWRPSLRSLAPWVAATGGWMLHNWVESGWPLYPFGFALSAGDWAMDASRVRHVGAAIRGWARQMGPHYLETLNGRPWLAGWWRRTLRDDSLQIAIAMSVLVAPVSMIQWRRRRLRIPREAWVLAPCAVALVVWFLTAPDIRFIWGVLWCTVAILVGILAGSLSARRGRMLLLVGMGGCMLPALLHVGGMPITPLQPKVELRQVRLPSGLVVWAPADPGGDQVWNAPLPATPEFADIEVRGPSLCDGFRVRRPVQKMP